MARFGLLVDRVWKRDGTRNTMDFDKAVLNYLSNLPDTEEKPSKIDVEEYLLSGGELRTKLARFYLTRRSFF